MTRRACYAIGAVLLLAGLAAAQGPGGTAPPLLGPPTPPAPAVQIDLGGGQPERLGSALEIVLFVTLLALAPAIVTTMTCFTRIVIVLSFLRRAMSVQELPPALVVTGFSVFLTLFVMAPVFDDLKTRAFDPYVAEQIDLTTALDRAGDRMNAFMLAQTRNEDLQLVLELSNTERPATPADVPFRVAVPAFVLSEIKTAFQMGFVLFLPFLAIDLFVASILVSMGMFTLPPIIVSTPLKVLLFVLVDGWNLVVASLARSFVEL
ncbi:MAG: flagellar type III secretion system pore protein FliP [Planctomycetes bacterium]|nr:flagellar type III secretion system pore protein FliP [Planctomycetota bacterium]